MRTIILIDGTVLTRVMTTFLSGDKIWIQWIDDEYFFRGKTYPLSDVVKDVENHGT